VIADARVDRLARAVEETSAASDASRVHGVAMDINDEAQARGAVAQTLERFGRLDILVVATYASVGGSHETIEAPAFDATLHTNVTAAFLLARAAAGAMRDGGSIVFYASMYGLVSPVPAVYLPPQHPNPIEYGVGKAAVVQMTRYLAAAYGPRGIRVNAVAPGPFPWPDQQQANPGFVQRLSERTMLGRIGRREETAGAVVFLASDAASYVTGHVLNVDGGWTAW
jgi:NAD(P)-dependent dehydrogenase (short-subunit alcohol dehydrogenase family)